MFLNTSLPPSEPGATASGTEATPVLGSKSTIELTASQDFHHEPSGRRLHFPPDVQTARFLPFFFPFFSFCGPAISGPAEAPLWGAPASLVVTDIANGGVPPSLRSPVLSLFGLFPFHPANQNAGGPHQVDPRAIAHAPTGRLRGHGPFAAECKAILPGPLMASVGRVAEVWQLRPGMGR